MDWMKAADAADALLSDRGDSARVVRDPGVVYANDEVFAFTRTPESIDDTLLVVDRKSGVASLVTTHPWEPVPFPNLVPLEDED